MEIYNPQEFKDPIKKLVQVYSFLYRILTPLGYKSRISIGSTKELYIDCEPECRMLPTPREFCRHILSERTTQAASNKRRLHPVSGGISL